MVDEDGKGRFSLRTQDGVLQIRANQGHSMRIVGEDGLLTPIADETEAPLCVHGTYDAAWALIRESGLNRMARNHVHFAPSDTPGEARSGMRRDVTVLVHLDVARSLRAGVSLFRSDNGVLLSAGFDGVIPPYLFRAAVGRGGQLLHSPTAMLADEVRRDLRFILRHRGPDAVRSAALPEHRDLVEEVVAEGGRAGGGRERGDGEGE